jgi:hypothetical protein
MSNETKAKKSSFASNFKKSKKGLSARLGKLSTGGSSSSGGGGGGGSGPGSLQAADVHDNQLVILQSQLLEDVKLYLKDMSAAFQRQVKVAGMCFWSKREEKKT